MDVLLGLVPAGLLLGWALVFWGRRRRGTSTRERPGEWQLVQPPRERQHSGPCPPGAAHARERQAGAQGTGRIPFAAPGLSGPLFSYGGPRGGTELDGPYAMVDVETTGLAADRGERVIEIAVTRTDAAGRVEDEYATLVNPQDRDVGATFVHSITNEAVRDAPAFSEVAGEVLARLQGAVVVAHNAAFEEAFLSAELARAGIQAPAMPALCTLWLGRQTFATPDHKLATLCQHAGISLEDGHAALGDTRAVARLLPRMLERYGGPLAYPAPVPRLPELPVNAVPPKTRAAKLRKGSHGWMASLMSRLPRSASEATPAEADMYLSQLSDALQDGKIVREEAQALAKLAGSAGLGAAQVAALNERFLESMREAALVDQVLTSTELRQLRDAAAMLGTPGYFDELQPTRPAATTTASPADTAKGDEGAPARGSTGQRRCGHCRQPGHYRTTCPELARR